MSHFIIHPIYFEARLVSGTQGILQRDRERVKKLLAGHSPHGPNSRNLSESQSHNVLSTTKSEHGDAICGVGSTVLIDTSDSSVVYVISAGVGHPPQWFKLAVDSCSSARMYYNNHYYLADMASGDLSWIGTRNSQALLEKSKPVDDNVIVAYSSGAFSGSAYMQPVFLSKNLKIKDQLIGIASKVEGFEGLDGVLGISPNGSIVVENMMEQHLVSVATMGMCFKPEESGTLLSGDLTFGGIDTLKLTSPLNYTPITQATPANLYWGVDTSIMYGENTSLLKDSPGVIDSGTTFLFLSTDAFEAYKEATGATSDEATGLLCITSEQYEDMVSMLFKIGTGVYELPPNGQIWPRSLNGLIGGEADKIYLITADIGSKSGSGIDFICGLTFLQRFYTVFDTTNCQIGIATTAFSETLMN